MDPQRIHAYLQAACAGLGFDIGEVWFTSNDTGASTITSIERNPREYANGPLHKQRDMKFLQLYLSKSYKCRRNELLRPESEELCDTEDSKKHHSKKNAEDIKKHVLSPKLVNAIASTAQVVWANCQEREGLLGRSDMRLQTAVGMPVAMDADGNMCIVVMFSPKNVQSSADAVEYLKSLSQGATSTSIPCLLPVMDGRTKRLEYNPKDFSRWEEDNGTNDSSSKGIGDSYDMEPFYSNNPEILDDFTSDLFEIPLLSAFTELEEEQQGQTGSDNHIDANAFDHASYGLWSTIMQNPALTSSHVPETTLSDLKENHKPHHKPDLDPERKERLEEFASAFLAMSVFDIADCWMPSLDLQNPAPELYNIFSLASSESNSSLSYFVHSSKSVTIRGWSGAVGNAFCSGNTLWGNKTDNIVDSERTEAFAIANVKTSFAIPIFSQGHVRPSCVLCFYSLVRSDPVPFVVKFVQQALRSLWYGLDRLQPHQSIGEELWKEVAPADLGEMAADLEMQSAFYKKKRSYHDFSCDNTLLNTKSWHANQPNEASFPLRSDGMIGTADKYSNFDFHTVEKQPSFSIIQNHVHDAVQSVADLKPFIDHLSRKSFIAPRNHTSTNDSLSSFASSIGPGMYCAMINQPPTESSLSKTIDKVSQHNDIVPEVISSGTMLVHDLIDESKFSKFNKYNEANSEIISDTIKVCRIQGCEERSMPKRPYCLQHCGNRQCEHPSCTKCAQGATRFCIAHGGGRRCTFSGCDKGARDKFFCAAHGGGKRCVTEGCNKSAVGGSVVCTSHGGGRRCSVNGCEKSAQSSTKFCVKHGGGKKCSYELCPKVARGRTPFCASHGGGIRCKLEGCKRIAIGKLQLCRAHGGGSKSRQELLYESEEDSDS